MLYAAFVAITSLNSVLAIVILIASMWIRHTRGNAGLSAQVNKIARTKKAVVFEIYSYASLAVWFALVLPWADLFTFQKFSHFQDGGLQPCFGGMTSHDASIYFVVMLMNILGAKAAMTLAELAGLLRKGRVRMVPHGFFLVWMPER